MQIIASRKNDNIDVQFLDEHRVIKEHNTYRNFRIGQIKNPYDRSVYGVGYIGVGKYKTNISGVSARHCECYRNWSNMLKRCYDNHISDINNTYYGIVTVCEEWHNYQNFAEWYEKHKYSVDGRLHLDKDILIHGNKIYSPETCILIPQRINELFTISNRKKDNLPQGIRRTKAGKYSVQFCGSNLGICQTYDEACAKYTKAKENKIKEVALKYRNIIPNYIYDILVNYEVCISSAK